MAKKILSFEEYQVQLKAEQDNVESTEEVVAEACEECGEEPCVCEEAPVETESDEEEVEIEDEESDEEESDEEEVEIEDEDDDGDDEDEESDDDDEDDDEDEESDDDDDDDEEIESEESEEESEETIDAPAEVPATVEEMLQEGYSKVKEAACAYENDDYQDHTLEMYMKENAALVAALAVDAMEEGYKEVKEEEMTQETYESACNEMKESYCKKIDELKEAWGSGM